MNKKSILALLATSFVLLPSMSANAQGLGRLYEYKRCTTSPAYRHMDMEDRIAACGGRSRRNRGYQRREDNYDYWTENGSDWEYRSPRRRRRWRRRHRRESFGESFKRIIREIPEDFDYYYQQERLKDYYRNRQFRRVPRCVYRHGYEWCRQ